MIYIALNIIFNAFILAVILILGSGVIHISMALAWCLGFLIAGGLTLVGYTRLGTTVVGLFLPGRTMIGREKAKVKPLFQEVIDRTNEEYGTTYRLSDFKIKASDDNVVNAFALGYDTLLVTRGAFEAFSDEQLRAILAHEMGHLYYRDSVRTTALIFSSFGSRVIMSIYGIYVAITAALSLNVKSEHGVAFVVFSWVFVLFFLPLIVLNWLGSKIFYLLNLKMSRGAEFRADAFAANLGYKDNMTSALEVLAKEPVNDKGFLAKLMATHPSTMLRIGKLEDNNTSNATNAPKNSSHSEGSGELLRLIGVVGFLAILWCGYGLYVFHEDPSVHQKALAITKASQDSAAKAKGLQPHHDNMMHITNVKKINATQYSITYRFPTGGTNTVLKHEPPPSDTMTLDQIIHLP